MLRTHTCGELRQENVGNYVTLCGWVDGRRDHGGVVFIDLRDRYGLTQIVFHPGENRELHDLAGTLRNEDVLRVSGNVIPREEGKTNPKLATGAVEVEADALVILNKSKTPPFLPSAPDLPGEDIRLRYRFIDLRREQLQESMIFRHKFTKIVRDYFDERGFLDIETPMLGRSTPEGARDYLVPSRVHEGTFYALPQSPQIYKQILMIAGL
ncbi:MAG TPA: amino acid--tRNA ligase-related protein, partial [Planctomycetaceae bacterium]|nr:amino acid--tRNA ligase-related protein [Planctomycetaceae bacterium]